MPSSVNVFSVIPSGFDKFVTLWPIMHSISDSLALSISRWVIIPSKIKYLVLDGIITQRLLDGAKQAGIEYILGHRITNLSNRDGITLKTFTELGVN